MEKAFQYRRLLGLAVLLALALGALGWRLVDLQVVRHDELSALARGNTRRVLVREPRRGEIRDIRGNLLATSLPVKTVCADPTLLGDRFREMARVLAPLLKTNEAFLAAKLQPRAVRQETNGVPVFDKHVVLKHKVRTEEWAQIQSVLTNQQFGFNAAKLSRADKTQLQNLRHKAIFTEDDQLRVYPSQALAAHVVGYVGASDDGEMVGVEGVERLFNSKLNGVRGWLATEKDRRGREVVPLRHQDVEPRDGLNVVLTIDAGIQHIVETELIEAVKKHTPVSVSATVVRPRTGEVLAMATLPNYDPNHPGAYPADSRRNRVVMDQHEPGSTFKIVVVSGALNDRTVTLADRFDCEHGHFVYAGKALRDHESYGMLSVEGIITKSSNIGSAKIGIKMGEAELYKHIREFGFGQRTGIQIPGEISGTVHPLKKWNKLSISRIPMGHEMDATPLQMVMAMSAIANSGRLMRPVIVSRLEDAEGRVVSEFKPEPVRQVIAPEAARQMVKALKTVVSPEGTALKAKLDLYTVAGKTGTAQKAGPGGYLHGKYFSSFIGFFPADNPELCISVVFDEPKVGGYYGGQTAAPVFKNIAERAANYLNIPPEKHASAAPPEKSRGKIAVASAVR